MKICQVFLPVVFGLPALELKKQRIGFKWDENNVSLCSHVNNIKKYFLVVLNWLFDKNPENGSSFLKKIHVYLTGVIVNAWYETEIHNFWFKHNFKSRLNHFLLVRNFYIYTFHTWNLLTTG